ncbi:MAG: hypothetical protein GX648_11140 [Crenarchaeota archaeon]|nr:hypothetical protein [Thermoproteota archaeon]
MANRLADLIIDNSYKIYGGIVPKMPKLRKEYIKSGLKMTFESYMSVAFSSTVAAAILSFIVAFFVMHLFNVPLIKDLQGALILSVITALLVLVCAIAYPLTRVNNNKKEIDANLIYTVGYMSVLAAGGISIERVFERIIEVEPHKAIRDLALKFTTNIKMLGYDVVSSLKDIEARSASEIFSKLIVSINSISKTSGDMKNLLAFETKNLLSLKREQLKKRLSSMVALAELYVTAMVMAPITFIIMITLLSVLGGSTMSLSPVLQLNLIVFFGIPVICVVFILILDSALPKED